MRNRWLLATPCTATDVAGLSLALVARCWPPPATKDRTWGYRRRRGAAATASRGCCSRSAGSCCEANQAAGFWIFFERRGWPPARWWSSASSGWPGIAVSIPVRRGFGRQPQYPGRRGLEASTTRSARRRLIAAAVIALTGWDRGDARRLALIGTLNPDPAPGSCCARQSACDGSHPQGRHLATSAPTSSGAHVHAVPDLPRQLRGLGPAEGSPRTSSSTDFPYFEGPAPVLDSARKRGRVCAVGRGQLGPAADDGAQDGGGGSPRRAWRAGQS